jgi:hypothetical protein
MTYGTPTTAQQALFLSDCVMGAISRLETTTAVNHKASNFSMALTATSSAASDYSYGLGESEKLYVAYKALQWAAEVTDDSKTDAEYEVYDNAVDLATIVFGFWSNGEGNKPKAVTSVQKELFASF